MEKQLSSLKSDATIILNSKWLKKLLDKQIDLSSFNVLELDINDKYDNTYLL
ncbi:hypothetical protein HOF65_01025 [bacterium]|nr:hypothetical protein [bacterium]